MESQITQTPVLLDELRQVYLQAHDWQQESLTFVPLRGTWFSQSEHSFDLEEEINKFLSGDKKVLLLLGDSGSGKSLYTQGLASKLWQGYKETESPIPVWISLPSLKNPVNRAIEETFEKFGFNTEQIETLKQKNTFIFILDAFDEIHQLKNLWVSNHCDQWKAKIIITCRREYLYHVDNHKFYFTPFSGEKAIYQDYEEIIIKPFSEEQIEQYVKQYIQYQKPEWTLGQYQKAVEEIPGLKNLIKTPFLLKLAMEALPKMPQDKEQKYMTQAKLYDVFVEQWFIRQEQKLKLAKKIKEDEDIKSEFWDYAKKLAQLMHQQKTTLVTYDSSQISDLFGEIEDNPWQKFFNADNSKIELLRTACLVREVGSHQYAFIHNSLLEYFLTRGLYENLLSKQEEVKVIQETPKFPQLEVKKPQDYFNERLLVEEVNTLQFLADRIEEDELFKKILFDRVYASRKNPQTGIAASNALTILNRADVSFSELDLSDIHAPQADLSGAVLYGTCLMKANLQEVILTGANLGYTDFRDANLEKANFGEYPTLECSHRVDCVCYSQDGQYMVIGTRQDIVLYAKKGNEYQKLCELNVRARSVVFSPDGRTLAFGGYGKIVHLWDISTQKFWAELKEHTGVVNSVAFSSDGKILASGSNDKTVCLWDISIPKLVAKLIGHEGEVDSVTFSPDGKILASGSTDETVCLWDIDTYERLAKLEGHTGVVNSVRFSPDGKILASGSSDKTVRLWDTRTLILLVEFEGHAGFVKSVVFSPDGRMLVSGSSDNTLRLWDISTKKYVTEFKGNTDSVNSVAFNSDGTTIASGSTAGIVRIWDARTQMILPETKGHDTSVRSVSFSHDGRTIASGSLDKTVRLWDSSTCKPLGIMKWQGYGVVSLAFSPDGKLLASGGFGGTTVGLWDIDTLKLLAELEGNADAITFSSDGKMLISGSDDNTVCIWDISTLKLITKLKGNIDSGLSIAISPDVKMIACGTYNNTVCLWDASTQKPLVEMKGHEGFVQCVAFSSKGKKLVSGSWDNTVRMWDTVTHQNLMIFEGHTDVVSCVVFSPDEKRVASGSRDKTVCLWDISVKKPLAIFKGHTDWVNSIAFSPDGNKIISGSNDKSIFLWEKVHGLVSLEEKWVLVYRFENSHSLLAGNAFLKGAKILASNLTLLIQRGGLIEEPPTLNADYFYEQGNSCCRLKQYAEAIKYYDEAIRLNANNSSYFSMRGGCKHNLGQHTEAIKDYDEAIRINPNNPIYFCNRGVCKESLKQFNDAIKDFDKAIRLNPTDSSYYNRRGNCKRRLGLHSEAIKDYDEAIRLDPKNAQTFINRGISKENLGQHSEAIKDYDETIRLNPKYALAFCNRGISKEGLGQHSEAIKDYDETIRLNPKYALAFCNRGISKERAGQYGEAIKDYDEAIRLDPKYALAFCNRGVSKEKLEQYIEAVKDYDEAIRLDPKYALAFCNRGISKEKLGQYVEAIKDYDEAIRLNPKDAIAFRSRGLSKCHLGQYSDALKDSDEAIRLDPKNAVAFNISGLVQFFLENYEEALKNYEKALEINIERTLILFNKAFIYLLINNIPQAKELFDRIMQSDMTDEESLIAKNYIKICLSFINWLENRSDNITSTFNEIYKTITPHFRKREICCYLLMHFFLVIVNFDSIQDERKVKIAYEEVLQVLIKVLKDFPDNPQPKYFFAKMMLLIGDGEKAEQSLKECLEISPKYEMAKILLENCKQPQLPHPLLHDIEISDLLSLGMSLDFNDDKKEKISSNPSDKVTSMSLSSDISSLDISTQPLQPQSRTTISVDPADYVSAQSVGRNPQGFFGSLDQASSQSTLQASQKEFTKEQMKEIEEFAASLTQSGKK